MKYWGSMTGSNCFSHYKINGDTILSMHHDQPSKASRATQDTINRLIIYHKSAWIGHQQLESCHSCCNHLIHCLLRCRSEVSDCHMKAIIDYCVSCRFCMPGLKSFRKAMSSLLIRKINDAGGSTTGSSYCSCLKVIASDSRRQR